MKNSQVSPHIQELIKKGDRLSPFLFFGKNPEILTPQVEKIARELLELYKIPKSYLFTFPDNGEKIKIKDIQEFIKISHSHSGFPFQIFFIPNISRLTISSSNSLLKFLEESPKHNIILLSNNWENGVLDTVLSRCQTIDLWGTNISKKSAFFQDLLVWVSHWKKDEIVSYFFRNTLEKEEYIEFLYNIIYFWEENNAYQDILKEVFEDIHAIQSNNVIAKNIVYKWLLIL